MFRFGWWTTGRDSAALELLNAVLDAVSDGTVPGEIGYVFCSREPGESDPSDRLLTRAGDAGIKTITLSAARFRPELRRSSRDAWRREYHRQVLGRLEGEDVDLVVLAGYMWVVSGEVCRRLSMINLHPAAPGGPKGTWQEVIWELLEKRSPETGIMMHLVTPELDQGPPVTYTTFPITGGAWAPLWEDFDDRLRRTGNINRIKVDPGESLPLFREIRKQGVRREIPLIVETLGIFAKGDVSLSGGRLLDSKGLPMEGPRRLALY